MGLSFSSVAPGNNIVIDVRQLILDNCQYTKPGCRPFVVTEHDQSQHKPPYWRAVAYDGHQQLAFGHSGESLEIALQNLLNYTARMALNTRLCELDYEDEHTSS